MPHHGTQHEKGNIFFTLFGAVALVGVIGAATTTLIRGPLSTVSAVNQKAKADTQMQIASKLAMIRATQQDPMTGGNCDSDPFVEPVPPDLTATVAPVGGGGMPTTFGASQIDPWGTRYGYCVWDLGFDVGEAGCTAQGTRLAGGDDAGQPVMVIISAGPNRAFETSCEAWADNVGLPGPPSNEATLVNKPAGSDDIIVAFTYDEALSAADGLWSIKSGDPNTITTDRNVEFSSGTVDFTASTTASFHGSAAFMPGSRLDLGGGGLFILPEYTGPFSPGDIVCNMANNGTLRVNLAVSPGSTVLEMCDAVSSSGFIPVSSVGGVIGNINDLGDAISYPGDDVLFMGAGAGASYSSATGMGNNIGIGIGAGGSLTTGGDNLVIGNSSSPNAVGVGNILLGHGLSSVGNNNLNIGNVLFGSNMYSSAGRIGIGSAPGTARLDVDGEVEATRFQFGPADYFGYSGGTMTFMISGATEATLDANGLNVTDDITAGGNAFARNFRASIAGTATNPAFTFTANDDTGMFDDAGNLAFAVGGDQMVSISMTDMTVDGGGIFNGYVRGNSFVFNAANTTGLFYASGGDLSLNMGGAGALFISPSGNVGIGSPSDGAKLDVDGAIRPSNTVAACGPTLYGAIRYASGDLLQTCSQVSGDWETIGTSGGGGGGGGSYWTRISPADPRLYYMPNFVGIGQNDPQARLHVTGTFLADGTYTGTPDVPVAGAGVRMMFDPASAAFRAGQVDGTQWDGASIGLNSVAMGNNATASGLSSFAVGQNVSAGGNHSTAFGHEVIAGTGVGVGDYSMAFGLGNASTFNYPRVTGNSSFGIFMGDQQGINLNAANTMALLGGRFLIDLSPPANPVVSAGLLLDVEGSVGAIHYCDNTGAYCFTAEDIALGSTGAPGNDREVLFNSFGSVATDVNFVFTSAGHLGVGTAAPQAALDIASTGAVLIPRGTELQRPGGINGMLRYNADENRFEGFQDGLWRNIVTGEAVQSFIGLTDTPVTYASAGQFVRINATEDGVEFDDARVSDLADVNLAAMADGDVLIYDSASGAWVNTPMSSLTPDAAGPDRAIQFKSGDAFSGVSGFVFTSAGRLGLGTDMPVVSLQIDANDAVLLPVGTGAQRPAGPDGLIRYNSESNRFEGLQNGLWVDIVTGSAVMNFLGLTDTPASYAGEEGRFLRVTAAADGVEFTDQVFKTVTGEPDPVYANLDNLSDVSVPTPGDGHVLSYNSASGLWEAVPTATLSVSAAGADRQIQFNSGGGFGASAGLTYDADGNLVVAGGNLIVDHSGYLQLPAGDVSGRPPVGADGMIRYNSATARFEGHQGGGWVDIVTGAAVMNFLALSDTPVSYAGEEGRFLRVTAGADGVEFTDEVIAAVTGEPAPPAMTLNVLGDVDLSVAPSDGQSLIYDSASGMWIAGATVSAAASEGPDRSIQFNSGGLFGGSSDLVFTSAGFLGVGTDTPQMMVDVAGELRFGNTALVCINDVRGALRYNSGNGRVEVCDGVSWRAMVADTLTVDLVLTPATVNNMNVAGCGSPPCQGTPVVFTLQNQGATPSAVLATSLTNTTNFTITSNTCSGVSLDPGFSCQIEVTPQSSGNEAYTGILNITGNNNPFAILQGISSGFGCSPGVAGGGGIYAACGLDDGDGAYDLVIMPGGCDGATTNPTCSGTDGAVVQKQWGPNSVQPPSLCARNDFSCKNAQNHVNIIAAQNVGAGSFPAASYCQSMNYGGKNDWYLPNQHELQNLAYPQKNLGVLTGFFNGRYWVSHRGDFTDGAVYVDMTNGSSIHDTKNNIYRVRCVRRENLTLPAATADTDPDNVAAGFGSMRVTYTSGDRVTSADGITISGILQPAVISVSGQGNPKLTVNAGAEIDSGTANWGDVIRVVMDAPVVAGEIHTSTVNLGPDVYVYKVGYADSSKESRVFVTSANHTGNLGGIGGGHTVCTNAANAAGIGGTWRAILSDGTLAAHNHVPFNWGTLKRMDGVIVASSWADLWDGSIQNPVNVTETLATQNKNVWTGANAFGGMTGQHNNNWTNAGSPYGRFGLSGSTAAWLNSNEAIWSNTYGLYCVEDTPGGILVGGPVTIGLNHLSDVDLTTTPPAEGQVLRYNSASGLWVPAATGSIQLPAGDTAQRPGTVDNGMIRYNTETGKFEGYQGGGWADIVTGAATGGAANPAGAIQFNSGGSFGGSANFIWDDAIDTLTVTGDIEYTGVITDISDMRLKTDIYPLHNRGSMLDRLGQVDTYSFRMKDDPSGRIEFGVMAQELERLFPELVHTAMDEMGTKSVNYVGLIAPMIAATQELRAENESLRAELDAVKTDIAGLKAHTGYGINKAEVSLWVLGGMSGGALIVLLFGRFQRRRRG